MDSGYYAACTALVSRTQALDTIANNLANVSTVGFRAEHNQFSSILTNAGGGASTALDQAINNFGILGGTSLDGTQGALQKTGNDLDVGIEGPGYFVVQTNDGPMYTRNGAFQVSSKGQLVTSTGDAVMGDKGVISVPPGTVSISPDGTISSNGAVTGKLKVVEFPAGTELTTQGSTYYAAPPNTAAAATSSSVRQGALESSNVNPIASMVELVNAQRSAEMMQRALTMFNSEIDKTATQDLPKVS
ncbi:MAG: flagellar basal-body rod protein FlgF [Terracidiphilus sp.]|jgi:flagellar basal-body rod protein FlgF/flagellar basal-body rod protein FlgG